MERHNGWIWNKALLDAFCGQIVDTRHEMQGINVVG
jgi:hypothetical protein